MKHRYHRPIELQLDRLRMPTTLQETNVLPQQSDVPSVVDIGDLINIYLGDTNLEDLTSLAFDSTFSRPDERIIPGEDQSFSSPVESSLSKSTCLENSTSSNPAMRPNSQPNLDFSNTLSDQSTPAFPTISSDVQ
ncbi:uncharacterized protein LOC141854507 [Brevipalpus obovatus]|uniref:uncharacterized protein LOC141854507 n=1 Tax=Brevipalpus obovatus TaxID=246614 RepID=UPI003D9F26BD